MRIAKGNGCEKRPQERGGGPRPLPAVRADAVNKDDSMLNELFWHVEPLEGRLESRIYRFTLQRQHSEYALVHPAQRFATHKPLQPLDTQGEFTQRERALHR